MSYKDPELLEELSKGNERAFQQLFFSYYAPLCEFACQYVSDKDAEEIVQDLMVYLWEKRDLLFITGSIKAYLFTAVRNRCLNVIHQSRSKQISHSYMYERMRDYFQNPDNYMLHELSQQIEKAIRELPDIYRETFLMSRFDNYSNREIAERSGISIKTVEYRISQALKVLRIKLKDYLPFWL